MSNSSISIEIPVTQQADHRYHKSSSFFFSSRPFNNSRKYIFRRTQIQQLHLRSKPCSQNKTVSRAPMSTVASDSVVMSNPSSYPSTVTDKTTPLPSTAPPPPPPPHKHEYERALSQGRVSDTDIELLKNMILESRGLRKSSQPRRRRCLNAANPPRIRPKTNETSRIRMEWRAYRLHQRCGAMLKSPALDAELIEALAAADEEEALSTKPPKKLGQAMLCKAKQLTPEQIEDQLERHELRRLREQALTAKAEGPIRENNCSTYRYKLARGEPIISSQFRDTFYDFWRPPFVNAARRLNLRYATGARHQRLAIDKSSQIWLWPTDEDDGIPLHRLPKEVPAEQKSDRRGAREKSRPPLRKHARADRIKQRKTQEGEGRSKRIPWNYGAPKSPLLVSTRDSLFQDELIKEMEDRERESANRDDEYVSVFLV